MLLVFSFYVRGWSIKDVRNQEGLSSTDFANKGGFSIRNPRYATGIFILCKGLVHKRFAVRRGCAVRKFCEQEGGESSDADVRTFWSKIFRTFRNL